MPTRRAIVGQLRFAVDRLRQGHRIGRIVRHQLADLVDVAIGNFQHPPDVAQHGARLQLAEGDDLGDMVAAVLLLDVMDHLVPPVLAEVDVEVGHGYAFGIQEPFEQQAEPKRVEIGDGQRPGDDRTRARSAPRADRDALLLRPADEVGDDQEVTRKAHVGDDLDLVGQPIAIGLGDGGLVGLAHARLENLHLKAIFQSGLGLGGKFVGLGPSDAAIVGRQDRLHLLDHEGASLGDDDGVVDRVREIVEQRFHLRRRTKIVVLGQTPSFGLRQIRPLGDADQRVVGLEHVGFEKKGLVGRDQRKVQHIGKFDQLRLGLALKAVAHDLDIKPPGKGGRETPKQVLGHRRLAFRDQPPDRPRGPARKQ